MGHMAVLGGSSRLLPVERILYGVKSVVRDSTSARASAFDFGRALLALPAVWAGALVLLVAGPWLGSGYIFGTDWPGQRRFDFQIELSSSAPAQAVLAAASRVISSEWTGKLLVLGLLFVAALMAFRAAPTDAFVPRAVASAVYLFTPFVFGRLHYGQMFLLAGYALLPWVAIRVRHLLIKPNMTASLILAVSLASVGLASVHMLLMAALLAAMLGVTHLLASRQRTDHLKRAGLSLLTAAGATVVLSAYWLLPFAVGRGSIANVIAGTTTGALDAYAAVPDQQLALVPNLLGLYGFWAENSDRFTSMKAFVPFWPVVLMLILAVGAAGVIFGFRSRREQHASWIAGLLIAAAIALVLEMGISHPRTAGLVTWLDSHIPLYRGMRDAGKWAALLALVYSQLVALGAIAILEWLKKRTNGRPSIEWVASAATGLLIALPLYYGNGLLFGMHGEIKPSQYPAGWYSADRMMSADSQHGRALFLPWHEYMTYQFIQNQNKLVASPAPTFFSVPVLVSSNPEVSGIPAPTDPDQVAIVNLLRSGSQGHWAPELKALDVRYVLLVREVDWESYRYLDGLSGLTKVADFGSIVVYRSDSR